MLKDCARDKKRLNKVCYDGVESISSSSGSGNDTSSSLSLIDRWFNHFTSYITSRLRLPQQQQLSGQQQQLSGEQQQQ